MNASLYLESFEVASVVWRESFEALLVVGTLYAWSTREHVSTGRALGKWIACGAALGLAFAIGLAATMTSATGFLDDDGEEYLQLVLAAIAVILMLRMVFWMRGVERRPSGSTKGGTFARPRGRNRLGLATLAALAVAREGAETIVFLFGLLSTSNGWHAGTVAASGLLGLVLAGLCFWAFKAGASVASKRTVALVSQFLLLVLGSGLTMIVVDRAISLGIFSAMSAPLWDTRWLLDDSNGGGAFVAGLVGYRSRPELLPVLGLSLYWLVALLAYAPPIDQKTRA
jgi:high-affinity iron transporter